MSLAATVQLVGAVAVEVAATAAVLDIVVVRAVDCAAVVAVGVDAGGRGGGRVLDGALAVDDVVVAKAGSRIVADRVR